MMTNPAFKKKTASQRNDILEELHVHSILVDSREIFLCGELGGETEDAAPKLLKNLRLLEQMGNEPIVIHQYSLGGPWDSGVLIYDAIENCSCHIIFIMHGAACSMGSIIPQAADTRIIMPNCTFLVHGGYTGIGDLTHRQSQSLAELEKKQFDRMLDIYTKAILEGPFFVENNMDEGKIRKFLITRLEKKEDWWLLSDEVIKYGFADGIMGDLGYESLDIIREKIENG
jgi:ATP-dependent Clp protease, protease subunit